MNLVLWTTILILFICVALYNSRRVKRTPLVADEERFTYSNVYIIAFTTVLAFVEAFRYGYEDTLNYKGIYADLSDNLPSLLKESDAPGFVLIQWLLRKISTHPQFIIIVVAIFITIVDVKFIKKYSTNFVFSLYLYFLFSFLSNMNGIRQIVAACCLTLAFQWVRDKKFVRYILYIILLSTIHKSILILIPLLFVFGGKRWNIRLVIFEFFCAFSAVSPGLINYLIGALVEDDYAHYITTYNASANIFHVLIEAVPLIMGIIYHRQNKNSVNSNRTMDVLINMQAVNFGFMVLATTMAQYARVGMYMRHSTALITPFLIKNVFNKQDAKTLTVLATVLYFAVYVADIVISNMYGRLDVLYLDFSIFSQ